MTDAAVSSGVLAASDKLRSAFELLREYGLDAAVTAQELALQAAELLAAL